MLCLTAWRTVSIGQEWLIAPDVREKYQSVWLDMANYYAQNPSEAIVIADGWYEPVKEDSFALDLGQRPSVRWVQNQRALVFPAVSAQIYVTEFAPPHPLLQRFLGDAPLYRSSDYPSFSVYDLPRDIDLPLLSDPISLRHIDGAELQLLGYDWIADGESVHLISYWEATTMLATDSSTFLHVLDGSGELIAQYDGLDVIGVQSGDRFLQLHTLPSGLNPAEAMLGLYTRQSGQRYRFVDGTADVILIDFNE